MNPIVGILESEGPMLSGELQKRLIERGYTSDAARKQISRVPQSEVWRFKQFGFENNQSFLFLPSQRSTTEFYDNFIESLRLSGKVYYSLIQACVLHKGYINEEELATYTFAPIGPLKGHIGIDSILDNLVRAGILRRNSGQIELSDYILGKNLPASRALALAKKILADQYLDWLRKMNIIGWNSGEFNSDHASLQWGITAPSYILPFLKTKKGQRSHGFVITDILIGQELDAQDVAYFTRKLSIVNQFQGRPVLPILLADTYSQEAFTKLKTQGIIPATVTQLFGTQYAQILRQFLSSLERASEVIQQDPEKIFKYIDELSTIRGRSFNIKGDLFELIVGVFYSLKSQRIEIGKKVATPLGERAEVDVFAIRESSFAFAECKGVNYRITLDEVEEWVKKKIPIMRRWADQTKHGRSLIFEYWSTGGYTPEALVYLQSVKATVKKYAVNFYDQEGIKQEFNTLQSAKLKALIREHFIKEL